MTVVRLIRHGQASFGLRDYDKLSDLGVLQSQQLGKSLKRRIGEVDLVVRGNMARHRQTADAVLEAMGLEIEQQVDEHWNEYDHRELIVRHKPAYRSRAVMAADFARRSDPRHHFQLMFDDALARWTGGDYDADYAEPWQVFMDRAAAGLDAIVGQPQPPKNVLVFTSGGPTSAVSARLLGLDVGGWLKLNRVCANASETKVVSGRSGVSLVTYNGHAHFDSDRDLLTYR